MSAPVAAPPPRLNLVVAGFYLVLALPLSGFLLYLVWADFVVGASLRWVTALTMVPAALWGVNMLLKIFGTRLSAEGASQPTLFGWRALEWDEVTEVVIKGLELHIVGENCKIHVIQATLTPSAGRYIDERLLERRRETPNLGGLP